MPQRRPPFALGLVFILALVGLGLVATNRWLDRDVGGPPVTLANPSTTQRLSTVPPATDSEPVRLAVAGDVGTGGAEAYKTAEVMDAREEQAPFDALLLLGDNVYENGDPDKVVERVFEPFGGVLDGVTQVLAVLGNHDVRNDNGPTQAEALGMPGRWYSKTIGNVLIVALDSTKARDGDQLRWLEQTLAASRPDFTIVIMHHPAFSAGHHGGSLRVQENFVPLFDTYGVDLVLSGHDHDYQRSHNINGVTYVVTGAAAKLRPTGSEDFTAVSASTHSFVELVIYADRISASAIDHSGTEIDRFEIR